MSFRNLLIADLRLLLAPSLKAQGFFFLFVEAQFAQFIGLFAPARRFGFNISQGRRLGAFLSGLTIWGQLEPQSRRARL